MVQTEDQYIFVHDAILEGVTSGCTEVPARNLYAHMQKLMSLESGSNLTLMEVEFKVIEIFLFFILISQLIKIKLEIQQLYCTISLSQKLANIKTSSSQFASASLPSNKFKNRLVNILPCMFIYLLMKN